MIRPGTLSGHGRNMNRAIFTSCVSFVQSILNVQYESYLLRMQSSSNTFIGQYHAAYDTTILSDVLRHYCVYGVDCGKRAGTLRCSYCDTIDSIFISDDFAKLVRVLHGNHTALRTVKPLELTSKYALSKHTRAYDKMKKHARFALGRVETCCWDENAMLLHYRRNVRQLLHAVDGPHNYGRAQKRQARPCDTEQAKHPSAVGGNVGLLLS